MADSDLKPHIQSALKAHDVTCVDVDRFVLQCNTCEARWSPDFPASGGRLASRYWACPNGCNESE